MKNKYTALLIILCASFLLKNVHAQTLQTREVVDSLTTPWEIIWGPDGKIWFTEKKTGTVNRVNVQTGVVEKLYTASDLEENMEAGMLGMALRPDFVDTPWVYVAYTYLDPGDAFTLKVVKLTMTNMNGKDTLVNPSVVFDRVSAAANHDGCRLLIGPDKKLYITTGDASNPPSAQDDASPNGKIHRINLNGGVPKDNPFPPDPVNQDPGNTLWSKGHRNPQGLVFSPDGILYSSEHGGSAGGQSQEDELNIITKGGNYNWPDLNILGAIDPILEILYSAPAGIDYYESNHIPEWNHAILVTGLAGERMIVVKLSADGMSVVDDFDVFSGTYGRLRDVCISPDGKVYIATANKDGYQGADPAPDDDKIIEVSNMNNPVFVATKKNNSLKLYPNPSKGIINVSLLQPEDKLVQVQLIDMYGRNIYETTMNLLRDSRLDLHTIPNGIYVVRLNTGNSSFVSQLMIEH